MKSGAATSPVSIRPTKSLIPAETPVPAGRSPRRRQRQRQRRLPAGCRPCRADRVAASEAQMPAFRSPAPRPRSAPSTTGAPKRVFARGARPMLAPAVDMDGVGMADEQQPFAAAIALALAADVRDVPAGNRRLRCRSMLRACISLFEKGNEIRLVAGDALAADCAAQAGRSRRRDRARPAVARPGRWPSSSRGLPERPAIDRRQRHAAVGRVDAEQRIVQMAETDRRRADDRRPRAQLARLDVDRIGKAVWQQRLHARQDFGPQADRAAKDDLLRIGDGRDRAMPRARYACRLVQYRRASSSPPEACSKIAGTPTRLPETAA